MAATAVSAPPSSDSIQTRGELDFSAAADRYRRELLAHCYRMTGSASDADDLVQETYLRAWRSYDAFEGRASVRTWLYKIATNVCLTHLKGQTRRPLPTGLGDAGARASDELMEDHETPWLEPIPDAAVDVIERESIRLAFIAALQYLPARQRAVLILRDVLRWSAKETATALDTTSIAVNSALQRAHRVLAGLGLHEDGVNTVMDLDRSRLLDDYVDAFWRKDIDALVALLAKDAVWEMPPFTGWYTGRREIGELVGTRCPGGAGDMPMLPTQANGQPAFGLYMRQPDGTFTPFQLHVLQVEGERVRHVVSFFGQQLFARFGLPNRLTAADSRPGPGSHAIRKT